MTEGTFVALISVLGTVVIAGGGWIAAQMLRLNNHIDGLNKRIRHLEARDRQSWLYIRKLIDHAYKYAPNVPLPEPPEGWLEDDNI